MSIDLSNNDKFVVLSFDSNRFSRQEINEFKNSFNSYLESGIRNFIIDFTYIEYMDSSALGALINFYKQLEGKGIIALSNVSQPVHELLRLTNMDAIFKIFDNNQAALLYYKVTE